MVDLGLEDLLIYVLQHHSNERNVRLAPAIDCGVLGSIAVFDDGFRRMLGYTWIYMDARGEISGGFTVCGERSFAKLVNFLCHLSNFFLQHSFAPRPGLHALVPSVYRSRAGHFGLCKK